jgi:two-component system C4-dicarboxylate transport sensor histidine kinase DctB
MIDLSGQSLAPLSISYGIVRDFGGEIRASNREEGGTEMIIELPSYQPENVSIHA